MDPVRRAVFLSVGTVLSLLLFAAAAQASIYWSLRGSDEIGRASNDLSYVDPTFIQNPTGSGGCGMAVDSGHLYWGATQTATIARAGIDGSEVDPSFVPQVTPPTDPQLSNPCSTAVNATHIFWANSSPPWGVGRADIDGTDPVPNFLAIPPNPPANTVCGVAISSNRVYWTESNNAGTIHSRAISGSGTVVTISGAAAIGRDACGLAVDEANDDLYWTNRGPNGTTSNIGRIDLNFLNPELAYVALDANADPCDVEVHGTKLYWTELGSDRIRRADLNGANKETIFTAGPNGDPCGVAVDNISPPGPPTNLSTNPASPSAAENPSVLGKATPGATVRVFKDDPNCSLPADATLVADGVTGDFSSGGIPTGDGTETTFRVQQTTAAGTSDCNAINDSNHVIYRNIPAQPTFFTDPASPADNTNPHVKGSGTPDGTLHVYTVAGCIGTPTDGPVVGGNFDIPVSVPDGSVTQLSAKLTTPGGDSLCSIPRTYREIPTAPTLTTVPASPAQAVNLTIEGTGVPNGRAEFFANPTCSGAPDQVRVGLPADGGFQFTVPVADGSTTQYSARTSGPDPTAVPSPCSASVSFTDIPTPNAPSPASTSPASPSNDLTPRVIGTAPANSFVRLYTNADCSSGVAASGPAADFEGAGIEASVPANQTTRFWATATTDGGPSACSASSVTYTADTDPPDLILSMRFRDSKRDRGFDFDSSERGTTYTCSLDGAEPESCQPVVELKDLRSGRHRFTIVGTDAAGNEATKTRKFKIRKRL